MTKHYFGWESNPPPLYCPGSSWSHLAAAS